VTALAHEVRPGKVCEIEGCGKEAHGRYCWMHHRRKARGTAMDNPPRQARSTVNHAEAEEVAIAAALELADAPADDDGAYEALRRRFLHEVRRLTRVPGWLARPAEAPALRAADNGSVLDIGQGLSNAAVVSRCRPQLGAEECEHGRPRSNRRRNRAPQRGTV
jgi:hypothetical protein